MTVVSKSVLATGAAALLLGLSVTSPALAGGKGGKHFHFGHHHHHYHFGPSLYVGSGYGCGYYKRMWWKTGSFFWKAKYYDCIY